MSDEKIPTQEEVDATPAKQEDLVNLGMWPGYMAYQDAHGVYHSGCKVVMLNAWDMDDYFKNHPGMLVVDKLFAGNHPIGSQPQFLVTYTKRVSDEEMREFAEVQTEARRLIDERKAKRAEAQAKAQADREVAEKKAKEKAEAEFKELKRLAELGRKHEKNCKKGSR